MTRWSNGQNSTRYAYRRDADRLRRRAAFRLPPRLFERFDLRLPPSRLSPASFIAIAISCLRVRSL